MNKNSLAVFEDYKIRRIYDEESETWYFSVVDIIQVLIQQPDYQAARNYWKVLKNRLNKEGSESVTNCNRLKLEAADGKKYLTDVADPETLLRLIQSVPSPKAEPIKLWLAKVGYERMQDMADPARSLDRARYQAEDGRVKLDIRLEDETVWLTQQMTADLFQTTKQNISHHIPMIFEKGELLSEATVKQYLTVRREGKRDVHPITQRRYLRGVLSDRYLINNVLL